MRFLKNTDEFRQKTADTFANLFAYVPENINKMTIRRQLTD